MQILGIAGSLRADSYNRKLIDIATEVAPADVDVTPYLLHDLPLFDEDLESDGDPASVHHWKGAISQADALIIATPEYNSSIPGVLKNAIDWASRPHNSERLLRDKPVAILGASSGRLGTALAQRHLRQILSHIGAQVLNRPTIYVPAARNLWGPNNTEAENALRVRILQQIEALRVWTVKIGAAV